MTDILAGLWHATLEDVVGRAAHDVKDALNGVSLNVEVLRSRLASGKGDAKALEGFAEAAAQQLEVLTARTEAILFLARPHRGTGPVDLALTLKHLGVLLSAVAKSDGGRLEVSGHEVSVPTSAPAVAVRLVLASGLLALIKEGGVKGVCTCRLEVGPEPVVRFSHESAGAGDLDPALASALAKGSEIRVRRDADLQIVFPGYS